MHAFYAIQEKSEFSAKRTMTAIQHKFNRWKNRCSLFNLETAQDTNNLKGGEK